MLLEFGADISVRDEGGCTPFENSINFNLPNEVQEALFYYSYDTFSYISIHFDILLRLFVNRSPLYYEIIKHQFEVIISGSTVDSCLRLIRIMPSTDLTTLITNFEIFFRISFAQINSQTFYRYADWLSIENLNTLIETRLRNQIIFNFIPLINIGLQREILNCHNESKLTEYICFLLSYGLKIEEDCLHTIYKKFKYSELFKILLHMDVKQQTNSFPFYVLPKLLMNVTEDFDVFIRRNKNKISFRQAEELMRYLFFSL